MENMKLNNNLECPMLGLGTFMLSPEDAYTSTLEALKMGYSLIDTANAYVNERAVGRAIKDSGIDRKNIFLSIKIWASEYENENTVEETLERLGVDYVDLLYIHQPAGNWLAGYRMLEKAYREGKAKSIGISNFEGKYMEELVFAGLGKNYGKTPAQIALRQQVQRGIVVIPKSTHKDRMKQNLDVFDFELTEDEMTRLKQLDENKSMWAEYDDPMIVQYAMSEE